MTRRRENRWIQAQSVPSGPARTTSAPGRTAADPPLAIFARFLKFGLLAWGGPAAQIAMISKECVDEERWVSQESFRKTLAVYQVLPGPEAHELCVYFGRLRGGRLGGLLAGLGFMLPGFLLMLGLSAVYVHVGLDQDLLVGLKAAVAALVAMALVRLSRTFVTNAPLTAIAGGSLALTLLGVPFLPVLVAAGIGYFAIRTGVALVVAPVAVFAGGLTAELFFGGLQAGLLTFGGAYTVIPFLAESSRQWMTEAQFLDGLALSGILPAPLIIFSTFVGYVAGGLGGSLAMTLGIFLPAFLLPIFLHERLVAVAEDPRIRPFLLGVAAGVIGLMAAVAVEIVREAVVDVPTAVLAVAAFAVLYRFHAKLTVLFVVAGCGAAGALM